MSRLTIAAVLLCSLMFPALGAAAGPSPAEVRRVRPLQKSGGALLLDAMDRSPTIVAMLDRIEQSDVIVYINVVPFLPRNPAQTSMVSATKICRYVMVTLDSRVGPARARAAARPRAATRRRNRRRPGRA